jgi:hypothetical protein
MSSGERQRKLAVPCINLLAGVGWAVVAVGNFSRHNGRVLLPLVTGLLFLVSAAWGGLRAVRDRSDDPEPPKSTIFGSVSR